MPNGAKPEHVRERAVMAVLGCATVKQAARKAGVGYRTLKAWLAEPEFAGQLAEARRRVLALALGRLAKGTGAATTALMRALKAADQNTAVRAAVAVLDRATKGCEMLDVLDRLERLEVAARRQERKK